MNEGTVMATSLGASPGLPGGMYPVVTPQPVAAPPLLRPLRNPLYDTEGLAVSTTVQELNWFQRPLSQADVSGGITSKSIAETNLTQSAQIPYPNQFQLFGFLVEPNAGISLVNFVNVYEKSAFEFTFTGVRTYLQIPLQQIPQGLGPTGFAAVYGTSTSYVAVTNGVPHVKNLYAFNIGRFALMIRSTETFGAKIRWPNGAPTIATAAVRMRCYLVGIYYQAI